MFLMNTPRSFFNAAKEEKEMKSYKTGHELDEKSTQDRNEWLANKLMDSIYLARS